MVEQAKYEVLREVNKVEIRCYPSLVIVRVMVTVMVASTFSLVSLREITGKS
jgi:hypothetical protein